MFLCFYFSTCSSTPFPSRGDQYERLGARRKLPMEDCNLDEVVSQPKEELMHPSKEQDDHTPQVQAFSNVPVCEPICDIPENDCADVSLKEHKIIGRRIVDFDYLFQRIKVINDHNSVMGCTISNCFVTSEQCFGLQSKIFLKCNMCNLEFSMYTDNKGSEMMDINTASVAGATAIGIGHYQLQELLSSLEIPAMSSRTYNKYHDRVADGWESTALEEMRAAADEEKQHAIEGGRVSADGTPILTVVADGSWSKRSYRTNYSSLAGVVSYILLK